MKPNGGNVPKNLFKIKYLPEIGMEAIHHKWFSKGAR